jgi:hypothetical protein
MSLRVEKTLPSTHVSSWMNYSNQPKPSIITDGLVLFLDASNPSSYPGSGTNWLDLSSSSINGTITNGPVFNSGNEGYFSFDGVNDGVSLPGSSALSLNRMTISCWNFSSNYNQNGFMFEKTTNGSVNTQYSLFFNSGSVMYYRTQGLSTVDLALTTTGNVNNNQWNNIVATFDGTNKRIYTNGILRTTSSALTGTVTQNTTGQSFIGIYGNFAGYPFNGRISITQIYNRALSQDEINYNFTALRGRYGI